ncbi:MAG: cytochrome c peroxidase [Bacteroidota bacterium]
MSGIVKAIQVQRAFIITGIIISLIFWPAVALPIKPESQAAQVIAATKLKCVAFANGCTSLKTAISGLKPNDRESVKNCHSALINCRRQYIIESARDFNAPAKFEAEEPEDDYRPPHGLQQIEALLFDDDVATQKPELLVLATDMQTAAQALPNLFNGFSTSNAQVMLCLQLGLVRVMTLGITGFDAPMLKTGITESYYSFLALQSALKPFLDKQPSAQLSNKLAATLSYLKGHPHFDRFDRMRFLTGYAMPLQQQMVQYVKLLKLDIKLNGIFNPRAKNVFSVDALNPDVFLDFPDHKKQLLALGKTLFFDKRLSGTATRSCATCHQPDKYFTDGLAKSISIDGHAQVLRNAPTLLYAGYQHTQFWDGRAISPIDQIREVLSNKHEMAAADSQILARLKHDKKYISLFKAAFPPGDYQKIAMYGIAEGLTAYILSLAPRTSAFDRYMAGSISALNKTAIKGFNLFMGKAQCGTCHFAPLFNGLIPPIYQRTEMEIIGVPKTDNPKLVQADDDEGSFRQMPQEYNRGSFKTPTVRNVAKTGPYMHNGSFHTLEKVVEFYNAGGGNGWGLDNPNQTLSADSLKLTKVEVKQIVSFLNSLTDKPIAIK